MDLRPGICHTYFEEDGEIGMLVKSSGKTVRYCVSFVDLERLRSLGEKYKKKTFVAFRKDDDKKTHSIDFERLPIGKEMKNIVNGKYILYKGGEIETTQQELF